MPRGIIKPETGLMNRDFVSGPKWEWTVSWVDRLSSLNQREGEIMEKGVKENYLSREGGSLETANKRKWNQQKRDHQKSKWKVMESGLKKGENKTEKWERSWKMGETEKKWEKAKC